MDLEERLEADRHVLARLGVTATILEAGELRLEMPVEHNMVNAGQLCHGGFLFALADTALAYTLGGAGFTPATVDASITYLKPARLGDRICARATIRKAGRQVSHCEVALENQLGELVATFRGTCANVSRPST